MKSKVKSFDAVQMMRDIRNKISEETQNMTYEQLKKYFEHLTNKWTVRLLAKTGMAVLLLIGMWLFTGQLKNPSFSPGPLFQKLYDTDTSALVDVKYLLVTDGARCGPANAIPPRDLTGSIRLLDVVDRQREEVLARLGLLLGHDGGQDDGVFHRHQNSARCLACDFAGFQGDRVIAVLEGFRNFVKHG